MNGAATALLVLTVVLAGATLALLIALVRRPRTDASLAAEIGAKPTSVAGASGGSTLGVFAA